VISIGTKLDHLELPNGRHYITQYDSFRSQLHVSHSLKLDPVLSATTM